MSIRTRNVGPHLGRNVGRNFRRGIVAVWIMVAGCAPSLQQSASEVAELVDSRLPTLPPSRPAATDSPDRLTAWIAETLKHDFGIDEAVAIALLNNRRLRAMYAELGVSRADLIDAGLPRNPVFSVERRLRGRALEIDVGEDFLSIFLIPLRRRVAEAELDAAKYRVAHQVLSHAFDVRRAVIELQAKQALVEMRREASRAADASYEAAEAYLRAGNIRQLELLDARRQAAEARLDLATAEAETAAAREKINVLLGLWGGDTEWSMGARLPDLPDEEPEPAGLERAAIAKRFDLRQARAELAALGRSAGVAGVTSILADLTISSHFEREIEGDSSSGPSAEFPVPVLNPGIGARSRAAALWEQQAQSYAALATEIRADVRASYAMLIAARKKAEYLRSEVVPLERRSVAATQLQYNAMSASVFQLLSAKQREQQAQVAAIEALRQYWLARADLERSLGGVLPPSDGSSESSTALQSKGT